jgi:hypothetical protein
MVDTRLCASAHVPDSLGWMLRLLVLPYRYPCRLWHYIPSVALRLLYCFVMALTWRRVAQCYPCYPTCYLADLALYLMC